MMFKCHDVKAFTLNILGTFALMSDRYKHVNTETTLKKIPRYDPALYQVCVCTNALRRDSPIPQAFLVNPRPARGLMQPPNGFQRYRKNVAHSAATFGIIYGETFLHIS